MQAGHSLFAAAVTLPSCPSSLLNIYHPLVFSGLVIRNSLLLLESVQNLRSKVVSISNTTFVELPSSTHSQFNYSFSFQIVAEILSLSRSFLLNDPSPLSVSADLFNCPCVFGVACLFHTLQLPIYYECC